MASLHLAAGNQLVLWVQDRTVLSGLTPIAELQKGLSAVGFQCELRSAPLLSPYEVVLTPEEGSSTPTTDKSTLQGIDAFRLSCEKSSLRAKAGSSRTLAYAIWELMEWFGWSWPCPQITKEPEESVWDFEESTRDFSAALEHRIFFAEQIEITPATVLWLSRLRLNTLFPSNPLRFSDPEAQVPSDSLSWASGLGFDFMVGGDCCPWLLEGMGVEGVSGWNDMTPELIARAAETVRELWREMGDPPPRFSVWSDATTQKPVEAFITALVDHNPTLHLETTLGQPVPVSAKDRVLYQLRDDSLSPLVEGEAVKNWLKYHLENAGEVESYLFSNQSNWDGRLGGAVSPLLWRRQCQRIAAACESGMKGAVVGLTAVDSRVYLERAGFALSVLARAMWKGHEWDPEPFAGEVIRDQFEGAGSVVEALTRDMERWVDPFEAGEESAAQSFLFRFAHQAIHTEGVRDKLDQRISEIEESAPCETCIELVRALATLVSLFDLEESSDPHEAKAIARTIWERNSIDTWPNWLQTSSPLADRLRSFL